MTKKFKRFNIVVTRPLPFAQDLCDAISAMGDKAIHLPTIAFKSLALTSDIKHRLTQQENQFDWMIFNSPYAVLCFKQSLAQLQHLAAKHYAAIGAGTAHLLHKELNINVTAIPKESEWESEGLLKLPEFDSVSGKTIAIVRGEGGREVIEKILKNRGANVISLLLYQRILPEIDMSPYIARLQQSKIDIFICTSYTGVCNLKILFGAENFLRLKKIPLIVASDRIKTLAHDLGFQTIWVARNASLKAMLTTLMQAKKEG